MDWLFLKHSINPNQMNELFSEFDPLTKKEWVAQAKKDLKGKDFDQSLKSVLWDRITLDPFYTLEDLKAFSNPSQFHPKLEIPGLSPRFWTNAVSVLPGDSNESFLHALQNGADGLVLHLNGYEDLDILLKGVLPEYISILIYPLGNPLLALNSFFTWMERNEISPSQLNGGLLWNPSDLAFDQNENYELAVELFSEILELTTPYPNFKAFTTRSSRYSESGGNPLDALVYTIGELVELIDQSGANPELVFQKMLLEASVGDFHFGEIARLKAFRVFVTEVAKCYGIDLKSEDLTLLAQTSHWSKSILDAQTNLIRQTYEAMAGVFGGANLLWVRPFEEENAGEQERRIARNVSSILKEEAYLDKVSDPASGSFFLEKLEEEILEEIQNGLKELEQHGGWLKSFESREIHTKIRSQRAATQNEVVEKMVSKIGVNKYPASEKLRNDLEFEVFEEKSSELKPTRATYLCELLNQNQQ
jgi:methylmalonyl-CoA mutase